MIISKIANIVDEQNIGLRELSRRANITHKTAVKLYYADITNIRISTLEKLCKTLNVSPGDLLQYEPGPGCEKPVLLNKPVAKCNHNKRVHKTIVIPQT